MEFGAGARRTLFPLKVERTVFVDSTSEKQIQLCDVVAGAVSTSCRGRITGQTSEYLELLQNIDLTPLVKGAIWPEPEVDPDRLGTRGWSGALLDYLTNETARVSQR